LWANSELGFDFGTEMKREKRKRNIIILGMLLFCAAAAISQVKEISGFNIPDYDEKKVLKSQLSGDKARFESDDRIIISNLKIESFSDEQVDMTVTAPHCIYDRDAKTASSDSRIRIERENLVITGRDFKYESENKVFTINKDVKVVLASPDMDIESGEEQ